MSTLHTMIMVGGGFLIVYLLWQGSSAENLLKTASTPTSYGHVGEVSR